MKTGESGEKQERQWWRKGIGTRGSNFTSVIPQLEVLLWEQAWQRTSGGQEGTDLDGVQGACSPTQSEIGELAPGSIHLTHLTHAVTIIY